MNTGSSGGGIPMVESVQQARCNVQATEAKEYREPTIAEQLEQEQKGLINRLTQKKMLPPQLQEQPGQKDIPPAVQAQIQLRTCSRGFDGRGEGCATANRRQERVNTGSSGVGMIESAQQARCSAKEQPEYGFASEGKPMRSSIEQRIELAIHEGQRALDRAEAAARAKQILNKYPEFWELLDLLQRF